MRRNRGHRFIKKKDVKMHVFCMVARYLFEVNLTISYQGFSVQRVSLSVQWGSAAGAMGTLGPSRFGVV